MEKKIGLRWRFFSGLLSAGLLVLGACIPDPLEVRGIPRVEPQIVVSSQIIPDHSLVVLLTKSFGALEASDESDPEEVLNQIAVNDAVVTIHYDDRVDTLLFFGTGVYGGIQISFNPGEFYTLNVESESLGKITAITEVKPQVRFSNIEATLYFNGYDDTLAQISYSFIDPPEQNWYMLNVLQVDTAEIRRNLLNPRDFTRVLDDKSMEGSYSETFGVFPREFSKGDTIAVYLSNISKDYYDFVKLRLDNRFGFFEYLSEPVNYPSNVEGGKGYFNLYIPDIEFIILE